MGVGWCGWDFAVEVEDHVLLFHLGEDWVEGLVGEDAGGGVGGHACGVRLDAGDACLLCLADDLWSDVLVQVQRHEVVDIGLNCSQALAVFESCLDRSNRRDKVGLSGESTLLYIIEDKKACEQTTYLTGYFARV